MFMIHLHTKFHTPRSNDSLVTNVKPESKYRLHSAIMLLLFYTLQKTPRQKLID